MKEKSKHKHQMEAPFSGFLVMHEDHGVYRCTKCKTNLFHSEDKFYSGSGYASFMKGKNISVKDEKVFCADCTAFLGKKIEPDAFSQSNFRYDINSNALSFLPH